MVLKQHLYLFGNDVCSLESCGLPGRPLPLRATLVLLHGCPRSQGLVYRCNVNLLLARDDAGW